MEMGFFRHAGPDPASSNVLKELDSGFRRNDELFGSR
jgi:hypothetical protein